MCLGALLALFAVAGCSGPSGTERDSPSRVEGGSSTESPEHVDAEERRQDSLASLADSHPDIDFPDEVPVVQWVTPEERSPFVDRCMKERGFPSADDGGYHSTTQYEALSIAYYVCTGSYPLAERYVQPLNEAQIRMVYEYTRDVMIPCYNANGWPVDPASLPSEDTYVETWGTTELWIPPDEPDSMDSDTMNTFGEVCPLMPPSEELYSDEVLY